MSIRVHRKASPAIKLLAYPRKLSLSRIYPILWHKLWHLHASALHHWLFWPSLDISTSSKFPIQRNSNPFLLIMCIRRSRVSNNFSFPLVVRVDGAGTHQFSEGEKNAVFCFSFNSRIFLANLHAASRAHRSCHPVSSWDRSSNFGALGLRCWRSPGRIIPSDGFWSRMLAWRTTALVSRTHRIGFSMFELFRKIDEDFGGSISWDTQPNWRVISSIATALLSPFFLDRLQGCSSTWRCA